MPENIFQIDSCTPFDEKPDKFNERYENWKSRLEEVHDTAELIVAKQRHGPINKVTLRFDSHTTRFDNFVRSDRHPEERF